MARSCQLNKNDNTNKLIYTFNATPIKLPRGYFIELDKIITKLTFGEMG